MPEAVIVSAARTPIGRARKGSLVDARPDDLAAFAIDAALKKVPELHSGGDRRRDGRLRVPAGPAGHEPRAPRGAARRPARIRSGHDGEPLLRVVAPDDPDGVPRDPGRRGRRVRRGRGRVDHAGDGYPKDTEELHPKLFGDDAPIANVYIPMGLTAENVAEQLGRLARGHGPVRAALAGARGRRAGVRLLRARDHAVGRRREGRRAAARTRRSRSSRRSSRPSSPAGR